VDLARLGNHGIASSVVTGFEDDDDGDGDDDGELMNATCQ